MSQFAQYVFVIPTTNNDPIKLALSKSWDSIPETKATITQAQLRRALGIPHTPARLTVAADHPAYASIITMGQTAAQHVDKFAQQAATAKDTRRKAKAFNALLDSIKDLLS